VLTAVAALLVAVGTAPHRALAEESDATAIIEAWRTIRQMDCARCHGKHHEGLAAPSVLEFVRTQSRERFDLIVLEGDPQRGMPGYANTPRIADQIDSIYRYFLLRANGTIGEGQPFAR
jgi:mono/diheme cytochrome c family protein